MSHNAPSVIAPVKDEREGDSTQISEVAALRRQIMAAQVLRIPLRRKLQAINAEALASSFQADLEPLQTAHKRIVNLMAVIARGTVPPDLLAQVRDLGSEVTVAEGALDFMRRSEQVQERLDAQALAPDTKND